MVIDYVIYEQLYRGFCIEVVDCDGQYFYQIIMDVDGKCVYYIFIVKSLVMV